MVNGHEVQDIALNTLDSAAKYATIIAAMHIHSKHTKLSAISEGDTPIRTGCDGRWVYECSEYGTCPSHDAMTFDAPWIRWFRCRRETDSFERLQITKQQSCTARVARREQGRSERILNFVLVHTMFGAGGGSRTHILRLCRPPPEPFGLRWSRHT